MSTSFAAEWAICLNKVKIQSQSSIQERLLNQFLHFYQRV